MKKSGLLLISFLVISFWAESQTELFRYYNYDWKECSASEARFAGTIVKTDSGWLRKDYFLPKKNLQMRGLYKDSANLIRDGLFYYFHSNGQLMSTGVYKNNKKQGLWLSFHPNGAMSDSTVYDEDKRTGISMQWHNNGYSSDSTNYNYNPPIHISWHTNGEVAEAGRLDPFGNGIGKWQYFHSNGKISAEEMYKDGKVIDRKYFDENGSPMSDTTDKSHPAEFPGGTQAWGKFMSKKLYWPPGYELINGERAAIGVEFRIDENGEIHDIFLFTPFDDAFNRIVINAIKSSPKWIPQLKYNRRVSCLFRQTVNFNQDQN